jgi:hypothetical protein
MPRAWLRPSSKENLVHKIPTLFRRDSNDMKHVLRDVNPHCEWVLAGEGVATAKVDGTCVKLSFAREWWARREVKKDGTPPAGFVAVEHDSATGKTVGWERAEQSSFAKFLAEAVANADRGGVILAPGTFELCGPKINKNPVRLPEHRLLTHGSIILSVPALDFDSLKEFLTDPEFGYEGIVWWREPGNPKSEHAKLKVRDFA